MTNYNERVDEVLLNVAIRGAGKKQDDDYVSEAKQALISLIKELVAEAKPGTWVDPEDTDDLEWRGYVSGVDEFEQNLLKELEEV